MNVCKYVCVYECMYVYKYVYIYMYTCIIYLTTCPITISNTTCLAYLFKFFSYLHLKFVFYVFVFGSTYVVCNPSLSVLHCTIYAYKHSY